MKNFIVIVLVFSVSACSSKLASQDIVDTNMTISRLNAQKNANSYLPQAWPEGSVHPQWNSKPTRILMQSDSSITAECRYGDGWASGDLQFENGRSIKIKCQTNGVGKGINGCMQDAEFQTKAYKAEDGKCANLDKLEKFQ
jgi:hypothetical protein